jgi:HSP20 family protein
VFWKILPLEQTLKNCWGNKKLTNKINLTSMTLVRFKNRPVSSTFNNLMDDFLPQLPSIFQDELKGGKFNQYAPVNVKENEQAYLLELVAPGLEKEDFKVNLENNLLTVSAEKKEETENTNEKHIRREYKYQSFKRSFTVDENIDVENISAKYVNGVLTLNLPKKVEVKEAAKQIAIQ